MSEAYRILNNDYPVEGKTEKLIPVGLSKFSFQSLPFYQDAAIQDNGLD